MVSKDNIWESIFGLRIQIFPEILSFWLHVILDIESRVLSRTYVVLFLFLKGLLSVNAISSTCDIDVSNQKLFNVDVFWKGGVIYVISDFSLRHV